MGNCAVVMDTTSQVHTCSVCKEVAMLHCEYKVPVIASACLEHQEGSLPLMEGYVGECPGVVVRRNLVDEARLTGKPES